MIHFLNNIIWHSPAGPHSRFSVGNDWSRGYKRGYPPVCAFADPNRPDFEVLARDWEPGEELFCDGWEGAAPTGWELLLDSTMVKMVWDSDRAPADEL